MVYNIISMLMTLNCMTLNKWHRRWRHCRPNYLTVFCETQWRHWKPFWMVTQWKQCHVPLYHTSLYLITGWKHCRSSVFIQRRSRCLLSWHFIWPGRSYWSIHVINYWHYYQPCSPLEKFPSDNLFPGIRSTLSLQSKNVEKQNEDGITLGCHRDIFKYHCRKVKQSIARTKAKFYQDAIIECFDSKSLFRVMDHLPKRISEPKLQSFTSAEDLSNRFANYLSDKITNIRTQILEKQKQDDYDYEPPGVNTPNLIILDTFCPVTVEEIGKTIMCCPTTSCVCKTHFQRNC